MKTKSIIMTLAISAALTSAVSSCQQAQRNNPLLEESQLPYGAPDFSKIKTTDYLPAFETAIQQQRDNIAAIVSNPDSATFENTILAYEESGRLVDKVGRVFFALTEADKTPELTEIEKKVMPMLTELENEISFNVPLANTKRFRARSRNSLRRPIRSLCVRVRCCQTKRKSA